MHRTVLISFALTFLVLGTPVVLKGQEQAATAPTDSLSAVLVPAPFDSLSTAPDVALEDTILIVAPRVPWEGHHFTQLSLLPATRPLDAKPITPLPLAEPRLHPVRLSRFACTAYGLDRGANAGLFLGGLGTIAGLWDEKTAMVLVGAGAALGAIWGGTAGAEDPAFRMRLESAEP